MTNPLIDPKTLVTRGNERPFRCLDEICKVVMYFYRAELEREAGGRIFNAGEGTETHSQARSVFPLSMLGAFSFGFQVENTRYQGSSLSSGSSGSYGSSGSSGSYGSSSGSSGYSSGSSQQSSSSSGAASSSSTLDSNDVVETKGGKWVWSEVSQKWEWEAEAGAKQVRSPHLNL